MTLLKKNQLTKVKSCVERGDIELPDKNGLTPLLVASYYGQTAIVKYLCDKGARVNEDDRSGWTSLMYAAYYNYVQIAKILIEHNANKSVINPKGYTALYYAQKYGHHDIVKLLTPDEQEVKTAKISVQATQEFPDKYKLAIFPWKVLYGRGGGGGSEEDLIAVMVEAVSEILDKNRKFIPLYSYYEMDKKFGTKMIGYDVLHRNIIDNLWVKKGASYSINNDLISQVGNQLKVDVVLVCFAERLGRKGTLKTYLVDVKKNKIYKETGFPYGSIDYYEIVVKDVTEEVLSVYKKDQK